jgi:biopolymer transport protein ExbD
MIDVVFQLLLFFMLTSSFVLQPGIPITLPQAASSQQVTHASLSITLTKDHLIYLNDELVTLKELRRKLASARGTQPILIRSDRYAYVNRLIELWDLCREAGFHEVRIATLPE